MAAIIIEKTGGVKVDVAFNGNKVILGDDEMTLNLAKYERDDPVHIDIGLNAWGFLSFGISDRYAVQLEIPARSYVFQESEDEVDENGNAKIEKIAQPFDMSKVTVILWGRIAEEIAEGGNNDE